ncbi:hypothetical protein DJ568_15550 [Mucilaginibacter hurinus]|uniref:Uncharacterized protein n=1 Tax=Mucilaginibacter hurinus TaxID=2201324 RepID=A0A367GMN2_9SPHI|nr:hypothetical protein [Mucilaginibacter hurinus]RCH53953.1 hypothetical protein DJ568_15550 [Mucilaginibacter hurinus]
MTDIQKSGLVKVFADLVGLFDSKLRASVTVALIAAVVYLFMENKELNRSRIDDTKYWQEREAKLYQRIINRYDPRFNEIKVVTDSTKAKVDSTTARIEPVLNKVTETINKLKSK